MKTEQNQAASNTPSTKSFIDRCSRVKSNRSVFMPFSSRARTASQRMAESFSARAGAVFATKSCFRFCKSEAEGAGAGEAKFCSRSSVSIAAIVSRTISASEVDDVFCFRKTGSPSESTTASMPLIALANSAVSTASAVPDRPVILLSRLQSRSGIAGNTSGSSPTRSANSRGYWCFESMITSILIMASKAWTRSRLMDRNFEFVRAQQTGRSRARWENALCRPRVAELPRQIVRRLRQLRVATLDRNPGCGRIPPSSFSR